MSEPNDLPVPDAPGPRRGRAWAAIVAETWAIREGALKGLLGIAEGLGDPEALAAKVGRPLENTRRVTVRDGVAVVPVLGPIFRYANLLTMVSGATSSQVLATDLRTAVDDPAVLAIALDVNSPGGQVDGTSELAKHIRAASERKPLVAYVGGRAASAAYWLASAAGAIVVDETAELGSIGVLASFVDTSERDRLEGRHEFVSSQSPGKRPDVATDAGRALVQARVDRLAAEFIAAVARYRGTDPATVAERFGRGDVLVGTDAIAVGMADRLGTLEGVIAELAAQAATRGRGMVPAAQHRRKGSMDQDNASAAATVPPAVATVAQLGERYPALVEQIRTAALAEGAAAERSRILGIEQQALPGHEALIAALKADGRTTPEQAAVQVLQAERGRGPQHLQRAAAAEREVPAIDPVSPAPASRVLDASLPVEQRCKAQWDKDPKIRAEFHSLDAFTAYTRAQEGGHVRVLRGPAAA